MRLLNSDKQTPTQTLPMTGVARVRVRKHKVVASVMTVWILATREASPL